MANKKRTPIIEGNATLDAIARRFASRVRKFERIKAYHLGEADAAGKKAAETRAALNALKAGA